jgi:hypothetical protein
VDRNLIERNSRKKARRVGRPQHGRVILAAAGIGGAVLLGHTAWSEPPAASVVSKPVATSAPRHDRVGFPKDYRTRFKVLGVVLRDEAPEVLTAYGNEQAASVTSSAHLPYPDGSILVMEFSYALRDANNQIKRDASGRVQTASVEHVDVMKRGKGFGEAYGASRSGEWEYAGYRLDGSYTTPPEKSARCAACHRAAEATDFVYPVSLPDPAGRTK